MAHLPERTLRIAERPVVAAATRLSSAKIGRNWAQAWQDEAWQMYDQVGELRFVANAHAGSIGQANVYVGEQTDARDVPQEVFDGVSADLFDMFGGSDANREELMRRIALQLFVAGDGWIVGVPPETFHDYSEGIPPVGRGLGDLTWLVLSVQEVQVRAGRIHLRMGDRARTVDDDDAVLIRVWRPHPRSWWEADSPVRANLPVLRELVGLTKHVSASIDSRLAGAGLLVLPQSVSVVGGIADTQDADPEADPFLADLMDAMLTPIKDRDAASAVVPMVVKVPDEVASQIGQGNLITFSTPFDEEAKELRDEAIRRLALGLDAPPELLLGMGSVNHWSGWLVDENNAKTHLGPALGLICNAITEAFLRPALVEAGVTDPDRFSVWYDMTNLTLRPDRSGQAFEAFDRGALSTEALRSYAGFEEADAPHEDPAVRAALELVQSQPSLLADPGLEAVVAQIRPVMDGNPGGSSVPVERSLPSDQGRPG